MAVLWSELTFKAGDIIYCKIHGPFSHVLLATSPKAVAHLLGSKDKDRGELIEEKWTSYHARERDRPDCDVDRQSESMSNAVDRAREDIAHY